MTASALLTLASPAFALRSHLATAVDDPTPTAVAQTIRSGECFIGILAAHGVPKEAVDDWHRAAPQPGHVLAVDYAGRTVAAAAYLYDVVDDTPVCVDAEGQLRGVDAGVFRRLRADMLTRLAAIPRATTAATAPDIGLPPLAQAARVGPITLTF